MTDKKLFYFTANWCAPCKTLKPHIESLQLNKEIINIEEEEYESIVEEYSITSTPTLLLVDSTGNEIKRWCGTLSQTRLINWINEE